VRVRVRLAGQVNRVGEDEGEGGRMVGLMNRVGEGGKVSE
jgi:hypothetical protein